MKNFIDNTISLGRFNHLKVETVSEFGLYLIAEDETTVLLPNIYVTDNMKIGNIIKVFVYTDSEDRVVATTISPLGVVGDYVAMKVVDITTFGIFMNWGLAKDLLVPKEFQEGHYEKGETRVVRIVEDKDTNRIYGTEKLKDFLSTNVQSLKRNQEVELMILKKTPLGYKVLINESFEGLVFQNRVFQPLEIGEKLKGYIDNIREDNKVDVLLQPIGKKAFEISSVKVLDILKRNKIMPFTYKSEAKDISEAFGISKKVFKRVLTELIDREKIILNQDSIEIII